MPSKMRSILPALKFEYLSANRVDYYSNQIPPLYITSKKSKIGVSSFRSHGDSVLHVVTLEVAQRELVGQSVHRVEVQRPDHVPVTI